MHHHCWPDVWMGCDGWAVTCRSIRFAGSKRCTRSLAGSKRCRCALAASAPGLTSIHISESFDSNNTYRYTNNKSHTARRRSSGWHAARCAAAWGPPLSSRRHVPPIMDLAALDDVFEAVDSEALPSAAGAVASAASVEGSEVVPDCQGHTSRASSSQRARLQDGSLFSNKASNMK